MDDLERVWVGEDECRPGVVWSSLVMVESGPDTLPEGEGPEG